MIEARRCHLQAPGPVSEHNRHNLTNCRIHSKNVTADTADCATDTFGRCDCIAGGKRIAGCDGKHEKATINCKLLALEVGCLAAKQQTPEVTSCLANFY
jgi:hypothetical protein